MTNSTSAINVNVPTNVKEDAAELFNNLGLNMSTAINIFLKRSLFVRGLPFAVEEPKPTKEFLRAAEELEYLESHLEEYRSYKNREELKKALLSDEQI